MCAPKRKETSSSPVESHVFVQVTFIATMEGNVDLVGFLEYMSSQLKTQVGNSCEAAMDRNRGETTSHLYIVEKRGSGAAALMSSHEETETAHTKSSDLGI